MSGFGGMLHVRDRKRVIGLFVLRQTKTYVRSLHGGGCLIPRLNVVDNCKLVLACQVMVYADRAEVACCQSAKILKVVYEPSVCSIYRRVDARCWKIGPDERSSRRVQQT